MRGSVSLSVDAEICTYIPRNKICRRGEEGQDAGSAMLAINQLQLDRLYAAESHVVE